MDAFLCVVAASLRAKAAGEPVFACDRPTVPDIPQWSLPHTSRMTHQFVRKEFAHGRPRYPEFLLLVVACGGVVSLDYHISTLENGVNIPVDFYELSDDISPATHGWRALFD